MDEKDIAPALLERIRADFLSLLGDEAPAARALALAQQIADSDVDELLRPSVLSVTLASLEHPPTNTQTAVNGTNMTHAGLPKLQARANLIAYLRTLSDNPAPLPTASSEGADAGAGDDPFVAGVNALGDFRIAQYLFGQITARANNAGIGHGQGSVTGSGERSCPATRSVICWITSAWTSSLACSSAQRKPRLSVPPWLFTTMPRRPRRLAAL